MRGVHAIGVWIGGAALLAATAIDALSVIGRNVGVPFIGSIELVQAAVLVSGIAGVIFATSADEHARVRILTDRTAFGKSAARVIGSIGTALFLAGLLAGSSWLAADLWNGHEQSEVLNIPWRPLRLVANLGLLTCVIVALLAPFRRPRP